jgi:hypothetical protein
MTADETKAIRDRADRGLDWDHEGAIGWAFNDRDALLAEVDRLRAEAASLRKAGLEMLNDWRQCALEKAWRRRGTIGGEAVMEEYRGRRKFWEGAS